MESCPLISHNDPNAPGCGCVDKDMKVLNDATWMKLAIYVGNGKDVQPPLEVGDNRVQGKSHCVFIVGGKFHSEIGEGWEAGTPFHVDKRDMAERSVDLLHVKQLTWVPNKPVQELSNALVKFLPFRLWQADEFVGNVPPVPNERGDKGEGAIALLLVPWDAQRRHATKHLILVVVVKEVTIAETAQRRREAK